VATHRVVGLGWARRIVVLYRGRICLVGRFTELRGTPGPFADLLARQARGLPIISVVIGTAWGL